jgi:glutaredoxin
MSAEVILYTRKGCHLCEVVKQSLVNLTHRAAFTFNEVDIDSSEELKRLYDTEVPVVFINGKKAFKYNMDDDEFLRKLAGRS